jgi:hypothetical protein
MILVCEKSRKKYYTAIFCGIIDIDLSEIVFRHHYRREIMNNTVLIYGVIILVFATQIFLSKLNNKFLGFILPAICLIGGIFTAIEYGPRGGAQLFLAPFVIFIAIHYLVRNSGKNKKVQ